MMYLYWWYLYPTVGPAGWRGWVLPPNHQSWWNHFFRQADDIRIATPTSSKAGFCVCELLMSQNHEVFYMMDMKLTMKGNQ